jgi:hypothetical protein
MELGAGQLQALVLLVGCREAESDSDGDGDGDVEIEKRILRP